MAERIWAWLIDEAAWLRKLNNKRVQDAIAEHDRRHRMRFLSLKGAETPVERSDFRGGRTTPRAIDTETLPRG